jgi:hypothetical protein
VLQIALTRLAKHYGLMARHDAAVRKATAPLGREGLSPDARRMAWKGIAERKD